MEATREVVRVTGKPLRWTLWGVKIASWLLWGTGLLLVGVAACLIVVAINIRGMWFIIVAVMAALSGLGAFLSCYGYTQLLTFSAVLHRLKSGLDSVEAVMGSSGQPLQELRKLRDGIKGVGAGTQEMKTEAPPV